MERMQEMAGSIMLNLLKIARREHKPLCLQVKWSAYDLFGFVSAIGERLVLFAEYKDYIPNGFMIFRLDAIEEIAGQSEFIEKMVKSEQLYEQFGAIPLVRLDSWQNTLEGLMEQEEFVALETVDDEQYYPGKIEKVTARAVYYRTFDGDGEWEEKPRRMNLSELGIVRLQDPYLETYIKYIDPTPDDFMMLV